MVASDGRAVRQITGCPSDQSMRWSTKKQRSRFPADMLQRLELFGRVEFDSRTCGIDTTNIYNRCVVPFHEDSQADPDGFLTDLRALIAGDDGGFATFGAARLVWEFYGDRSLHTPAALPLVDAGIDFKLARNLPGALLTGYEHARLSERRAETG
jgi:hypothetical protein